MKATYFATILLSATLSLGAPTGLNDLVSSQETISSLSNSNPGSASSNIPSMIPLNQISSVLTPPPNPNSNSGSASNVKYGSGAPARPKPEEYRSGALREHKSNKRGLGDLGDMNALNAEGLLASVQDKLQPNNKNGNGLEGVPSTLSELTSGMGDINGKKRISKRDYEFVEMAQDHLGRKVMKRGNEFHIQEPADQGRQWGGANELDDENDEPFWG